MTIIEKRQQIILIPPNNPGFFFCCRNGECVCGSISAIISVFICFRRSDPRRPKRENVRSEGLNSEARGSTSTPKINVLAIC